MSRKNNVVYLADKRAEIEDIINQIKSQQQDEAMQIIYEMATEMTQLMEIIGAKGLTLDSEGKVKISYPKGGN